MPDISATYDGFYIVSARLRECVEHALDDVQFDRFTTTESYFNLRPQRVVEFDYERSGTRFIKKCDDCGNFESVVGIGRPPYLRVDSPILNGIFRTDILFASGNEKHPLIMVGIDTKADLENCRLHGLEFSEVHA
jgi:hypothetical protein